MYKAKSNNGVSAAAKEAKQLGLKRFEWTCSLHGLQSYYTSSKACPVCTVERKDKLHQRKYNQTVAHKYPHVKRPDGSYTRKKAEGN